MNNDALTEFLKQNVGQAIDAYLFNLALGTRSAIQVPGV